MRRTCQWTLALALVCGPLAGFATAGDGWAMPDLWPFNNAKDNAKESSDGPLLAPPKTTSTWPKLEIPRLLPPMRLSTPSVTSMIYRPLRQFNAASKRFWSGAASLMPFSGADQPAPRLYDDPITVGDFMAQPRLDP